MTTNDATRRPDWRLFGFSTMLGLVGAGILAQQERWAMAGFCLALMVGLGAVIGFSRSDWAAAQRDDGDERQRAIGAEALRHAYVAVIAVALIGFVGELRAGTVGPFTLLAAVGGGTQMLSILVLQRLR